MSQMYYQYNDIYERSLVDIPDNAIKEKFFFLHNPSIT